MIPQLNREGFQVTVDNLGELVNSVEFAREHAIECIQGIRLIVHHQLNTEMSVKLTSLGLDICHDIVMENKHGNHMEDSSRSDAILEVYKALR
ncbi:hypothetical protein ACJROX_06730 [Pseudalkalibacillus sp. A8]|uniref:hypothetical protein n=1 Tax=Pseudalkalibacillus sp. A8 TaxID=3382641 RepID=UPI0038B50502